MGVFKGFPVDWLFTLHIAVLQSAWNGAQYLTESLRSDCNDPSFDKIEKAEALSLS